jgi:hypothetical protein
MNVSPPKDSLVATLLARLERISVDSRLAHRASGLRGALLDIQQAAEEGRAVDAAWSDRHVQAALDILSKAGKEKLRNRPPLK